MAGNVPASHSFKGDGVTRVFPIASRIIGDDYVRIEIDGVYIFDRSSWDIVNNSIIFTVAPILNSTVLIKVAESVEAVGLLDNQSTADIIEANIPVINGVYNGLDIISSINDSKSSLIGVDNNKVNIDLVAGSIDNLNIISDSLGDLQSIKNHNNLTGRNEPNAHPISAITGLQETLNGLSNDGGLFPTIISEYPSRDTYISCKVSPTELKAIKYSDLMSMNYNNTPSTSTIYSNLGITQDVFGAFNSSQEMYDFSSLFKFTKSLSTNDLKIDSSDRMFVPHPLQVGVYLRLITSTLYLYDSIKNTNSSYMALTNNSTMFVITDTFKLVTLPLTGTFFEVVDLKTKTKQGVLGTESIATKYADLQLHPNGKVYGIPSSATSIIEIDPETATYTLYGDLPVTNNKYCKGFLGTNGNIYMLPRNASSILEFNPTTKVLTEYGDFGATVDKFFTGTLGTDGRIHFIGYSYLSSSLFSFNVNTKLVTEIDLSTKINNNPMPASPTPPYVTRSITGVDGCIYFIMVASSAPNHIILRGDTGYLIGLDPNNDFIRVVHYSISSHDVSFFHYLNDTIVQKSFEIQGSNRGSHYWVRSNYFLKGF